MSKPQFQIDQSITKRSNISEYWAKLDKFIKLEYVPVKLNDDSIYRGKK